MMYHATQFVYGAAETGGATARNVARKLFIKQRCCRCD